MHQSTVLSLIRRRQRREALAPIRIDRELAPFFDGTGRTASGFGMSPNQRLGCLRLSSIRNPQPSKTCRLTTASWLRV